MPEVRPAEKAPCPVDLAGLDGVLKMLVDYMLATARRPQPVLAVGASLCALGALMGRKYRTESNLRSNLYVVGIADSGSGKNHSREVITELFVEAGLGHTLGGNKIASGAGLLTAVHRQPAILFQIDEFGMFLSAAADRKRSPRHITEILDIDDRDLHHGRHHLPRCRVCQPRRQERTARHQSALPLRLRHDDADPLLERAAVVQRRRRLARPLHRLPVRG